MLVFGYILYQWITYIVIIRLCFQTKLPYWCFGVFDGHAGAGASLATVNQLQDIIHEKLHEIQDVIVCDEKNYGKLPVLNGAVAPTIDFEAVVTGALEQSFLEMVIFHSIYIAKVVLYIY